ncbi:hypothetical protein D3OALGB2SA_2958 [Olavius algarvensis associated proteobacterium Delta 3]|nr:hypothetical protein D3OALGB2SA_2958 [Olavius algarvensis associated proteobacterium Delta 3]
MNRNGTLKSKDPFRSGSPAVAPGPEWILRITGYEGLCRAGEER